MVPVGLMSIGEKARVREVGNAARPGGTCTPGGSGGADSRLQEMGLREGQTVEMLNNDGKGPVLLKVDNSRIAIDRGMAMRIKVTMREEQ